MTESSQQGELLAKRLGVSYDHVQDDEIHLGILQLGTRFMLNLEKLPVLFPSSSTDIARVKSILQSNSETSDKVTLIVSNDKSLQEKLHQLTSDFSNLWVAPSNRDMTALLLSNDPQQELARIIASQIKLTQISPYRTGGGTTKETVFFGRSAIISHIMNREPANYLMMGGRQLGKSSLLKALERGYRDHPQVSCYYIPLQGADFKSRLVRTLALPDGASLDEAFDQLRRGSEKRHLFLIDEADAFVQSEGEKKYPTLQALRALSEEGKVHFILAGFWELYQQVSLDYQSPLRNFGEAITIGALEEEACHDLATKPMASMNIHYDGEQSLQRLLSATGQRANLISIACNEIVKNLDPKTRAIDLQQVEKALDSDAIMNAMAGWDNVTRDVDPNGRITRMIVYSTIEQGQFNLASLLKQLSQIGDRTPGSTVERILDGLTLTYVLARKKAEYSYTVPLFREQILEQNPKELLEQELARS